MEPMPEKEKKDSELVLQENREEVKKDSVSYEFLQEIRFNLLARDTVSYMGENNNIPDIFFDNYYVDALLMTKGNEPYAIYLGNGKNRTPGQGKVHYSMKDYYVKLITITGQFDGVYINSKEIDLEEFKCDKLCNTFDKIPANSNILFEFKNGKRGENKVISQAIRYQENAKEMFGGDKFYHIIIVRDKLFNALKENASRINSYNFSNFAILKICGNPLKIFNKYLSEYKDADNKAKNPMSSKNSVISHKTSGSKCGNAITRDEFNKEINGIKDGMNAFKTEIKNEMNGFRAEINGIKNEMNDFKTEIKREMNAFKTEMKNEMKNGMNSIRKEIMDELDKKFVSALTQFFNQNPSIIQSVSTAPNSPEIQK